MPFDQPQFDPKPDPGAGPLVSRPQRVSPPLMLAGVAGACLLGASLGLWARPTNVEHPPRRVATLTSARPTPRQIEIRVDHPPAPAEPAKAAVPTEVVARAASPVAPRASSPPARVVHRELLAPQPAPEGLMRVRAVVPERLLDAPRPSRAAEPDPRSAAVAARRSTALAAHKAQAAHETQEARAEAKAGAAREARRETARIAAAAETRARTKAKVQSLAQAHAKTERRFAARKAAEHLLAEQKAVEARQTQLAQAQAQAKAARAAATRMSQAKAARLLQARAAPPRDAHPVRLVKATAPRCAAADPGAALTCADPALGAADRQLSRAYRQAQAAGVPSDRLERQQQHWLTARANAARQAPWAVHDIYLARIAELQDQTREASSGD